MEIKCSDAYPLWLVRALNQIGAYPQSCSKYGMAYKLAKPGVFYGQESGHAYPIVTEAGFDFEGFTDEELEEAGLLFAGIPA